MTDEPDTGAEVRLPNCEIAWRSLSEITEAAGNPKVHSAEQVKELADSISKFGWMHPIEVTPTGELITGHGRLAAARRLGLSEVPVQVIEVDATTAKAMRISDNRLAEGSEWNVELLGAELADLREVDFDTSVVGFSDDDIDDLLAQDPETGEPVEPDSKVKPVSKRGDVWVAGRHRLICGDPSDPKMVARVLDGAEPDLMVTDWGRSGADDPAPAIAAFPGRVAYIWGDPMRFADMFKALHDAEFAVRAQLVWDKARMTGRGKRYRTEHEVAAYAVREGSKSAGWRGDRSQLSVWEFDDKPLSLPVDAFSKTLKNSSGRGGLVFDPFIGQGTVLVAAEMTGRTFIGMEADPARLDAAVRRWGRRAGDTAKKLRGKRK